MSVEEQISELVDKYERETDRRDQPEADSVAQTAEIVIMTHPAQEKAMQQALDELTQLTVVKEIGNFVRVEA